MSSTLSRNVRSAVVREPGGEFRIETLRLREMQPHEVEVRVVATGVCHTDAYVKAPGYPLTVPAVLGHEGAGVVERVGANVRGLREGDHVVLTFSSCGLCTPCRSGQSCYCAESLALNFDPSRPADQPQTCDETGAVVHDSFFGQSSFSTRVVVSERNAIRVPADAPLELLGPLGCGIQTGAGAVLNTFKVPPGSSVVVFGSGAVGLAAVMGARVAGATTIVAVDMVAERLTLATELGATEVVDAGAGEVVSALNAIAPGGFDFALETTGRVEVVEQAVQVLAIRGSVGVIGVPPLGARASFDLMTLFAGGRTIRGIVAGDSVPSTFIPVLVELQKQGRFPIEKLVRFYDLEQVNEAMADSARGGTIKPILRMPV